MEFLDDNMHGDADGEGEDAFDPIIHDGIQQLILRWTNEKYAPEVLPFDQQTVEDLSEALEFVNDELNESAMNGEAQDPDDPTRRLQLMDYERVKYVMIDYLRIRLWKIQKCPQHYNEPDNIGVLSKAERQFMREAWDSKVKFLHNRLLSALPNGKETLDDKLDSLDMVSRPNLERHVYARIMSDIPKLTPGLSPSTQGSEAESLTLNKGDTYLLRYSVIRDFLIDPAHDGKVQLV